MPEPLTACVIGASGRMGQEHVAAYEACGVNVVPVILKLPCDQTYVSQTVNIGEIVSICTPDEHHFELLSMAVHQKKHVMTEKPIVRNQDELGILKEELEWDSNKHIHIGQNFPLRHQPIFADLKDRDFGEIYRIEASYNWGRTHKLFEGWRAEDPDYSLVMGGLIHMVDLVLWLTGLDMEVVSAIGCNKSAPDFPNHDTVTAQCRLSNGGVCNLVVDGGMGVQAHNHVLNIFGTKRRRWEVNYAETDKQACIKEFVRRIRAGEPPERDFRATEICLEIDKFATS